LKEGNVRGVPSRDGRCNKEDSAPVGRHGGVQRSSIGADGSSSFCSGEMLGKGKVIIIVGSSESYEGGPCTLFQGVEVEIRSLKSVGLMYDGVEGVRRGQSKVAMESSESYITLMMERGEAEFHVEETDGGGRDLKDTRE
jgi:hypothetical protein